MKNLYFCLFLGLFSILHTPLVAQDAPWLEVGSEWTYQHGHVSGPEHYQVTYGITEETTFAGKACAKMDLISDLGLACMGLQPPFYFYVSNDSLYFANDELDDFRLAIDFGAEPGDSWEFVTGYGESTTSFTVTVNSVSMVDVDEFLLRRLNVTYEFDIESGEVMHDYIYPETMEITEVIGAQHMFFIPMGHGSACDFETDVTFQCFDSASFNYLNPEFPSCNYVVGLEEKTDKKPISVFPNPVSDVVNIEVPPSWAGTVGTVQLLNSKGQLVYAHSAALSSREYIPVGELPRGMYLLSIQSEKEQDMAKIVLE